MTMPKFRAWKHTESPEMINDIDFIDWKNGIVGFPYQLSRDTFREDEENINNMILMQSIGRTGMNKNDDEVDIFQGDIIQVIEQECQMGFYVENEYVGAVEYDQGHCTYYLNLIKTNYYNELPDEIDGIPIFKGDEEPERYYFNDNLFLVSEDIQILGNIYENPELLEEI